MREARTFCCPPAWKERDAYDRMLELDLAGWTWEALRCRPDDAGRILPLVGTRLMRRSDPTGDRDPGQRRTGDLRAGDFRGRRSPASVFWRADFDPAVLTVRAAPVAAADGDAFRLDRLPCRATVRRLGGGREQIVIGEGVRSIRIEVREGSVLSGPVRLAYDLARFVDLDIGLRVLGQFEALHRGDRLLPTLFRGEPRARRWAMALRAWDGRRNGAEPARDRHRPVRS